MASYEYPKLQPLPLGKWGQVRRWVLLEDWQYRGFVIPKGFITDGASVPRILYWLFEPTGILFIPAILHDYFYATKTISRADADRIFRENMIKEGCWLAGWLAWIGVRLFGWIPWMLHKDSPKSKALRKIKELRKIMPNIDWEDLTRR